MSEKCFICDEPGAMSIELVPAKKLTGGALQIARHAWVCEKHAEQRNKEAERRKNREVIGRHQQITGQGSLLEGVSW